MNEHVTLGTRDKWGLEEPIVLSAADRRQHLYCIGKSGTGKTTLLRNLILQDVTGGVKCSHDGRGQMPMLSHFKSLNIN